MRVFIALTLAFLTVNSAWSAVIDFRDSTFASTFGPNVATDTVDGVNFTFTSTARGINGFRQSGTGLRFGVPGNGMYSLSIVADTNLKYTFLEGKGHTLTSFAGQLPFDVYADSNLSKDNLMFGAGALSVMALGDIHVAAGDTFLINVDFSALTGSSIYASAVLQTLGFEVSTVPLPASVWLFGSALAAVGFFARKKQTKA